MKGVYINSKIREQDQQIMAELMEEHEVRLHRSLWTAEKVLAENGCVDFMVTNMPHEEMSMRLMGIYSHLCKRDFYQQIYRQSYACLERIYEQWPELTIVVYTGADEDACLLAAALHKVEHLIRRGRNEVKHEIAEIKKALAGEEYSPFWLQLEYAKTQRVEDAD